MFLNCFGISKNPQTTQPNFSDYLTEDCLISIFQRLDLKDLGKIAAISKKFEKLQSNPVIWKTFAEKLGIDTDQAIIKNRTYMEMVYIVPIRLNNSDILGEYSFKERKVLWAYRNEEIKNKRFTKEVGKLIPKKCYFKFFASSKNFYVSYKDEKGQVRTFETLSDAHLTGNNETLITLQKKKYKEIPIKEIY